MSYTAREETCQAFFMKDVLERRHLKGGKQNFGSYKEGIEAQRVCTFREIGTRVNGPLRSAEQKLYVTTQVAISAPTLTILLTVLPSKA